MADCLYLFGTNVLILVAVACFLGLVGSVRSDRRSRSLQASSGELIVVPHPPDLQQLPDLQHQCLRLKTELQQQRQHLQVDFRNLTFEQLEPLLIAFPTVRMMVQAQPDLPAQNVIALFTSLDNWLQDWGIEPIGSVWQQVAYDPQRHQPDEADLVAGEPVYVRFVGYQASQPHPDRSSAHLFCPARVSRTLPTEHH